MENLDFSEEEIQEQLALLGYGNITKERLRDFKRDLDLLIYHEKSKSNTSAEWSSSKSNGTSCRSPPAFTKEKVQIPCATSRYNYVYSGNSPADQHRQVLTSTFNDENCDSLNLMPGDSYIKHTVAPQCIRSSTASNRLEVLDESSDIYPSVLAASEPVRPQQDLRTTTKPALKRKVLRKRQGQTQVCDESTHSEDSENTYEEDTVSLSSSFWTDQEDSEECNTEDGRIETGLEIYKQEMNKDEEQCAKDASITEHTGGKLTDLINEDNVQCYAKEQNTDKDSACRSEVNQHDYCSPETPGKVNRNRKQKSENKGQISANDMKKRCTAEKTSGCKRDIIENVHTEFVKVGNANVKEDNTKNKKEVRSNCFIDEGNVQVSLSEGSESEALESDEEIEYFASLPNQRVTKEDESKGENFVGDEGWSMIFGTQDDISKPAMDDEEACVGARKMYTGVCPESRISLIAEQNSATQTYTEDKDNNGSAEQIWNHSSDLLETGVYNKDFHGSMNGISARILTSGYGTYTPDSPKDDSDSSDDCLSELELETDSHNLYAQDNPSLSWYRRWLSPDVARQLIPSASVKLDDWDPFDSGDNAVYNHVEAAQGTAHENRAESLNGNPDDTRKICLSAESNSISAKQEKDLETNRRNYGFCSKDQEDEKTFRINDARLNECKKTFKDQKLGYGPAIKTEKKSQHFRFSVLEEHLTHLHVSPGEQHELYTDSEETSSYSERNSSGTEELPSAFQIYIKGMTRSRSENDLKPRLKSFIRPVIDHPHTRTFKKADPVARYFQYKQDWEMFKPPGEKRRKELHWAIREQLEYQPPPPRPQRTYIPNTYVVPTEKKRSALRWEIRHNLANGIVPARVTYT